MPRSGQIIPKYSFPHSETYINDYTIRTDDNANSSTSSSTVTYSMHVFPSPSGPDRVMTTINGGLAQFRSIFGTGDGKKYGQSYMNAYAAAASGGAILQCLRVTPKDAAYSNAIIWVGIRKNDGVTTEATGEYTDDDALTDTHKVFDRTKTKKTDKYTTNVYREFSSLGEITNEDVTFANGDIWKATADIVFQEADTSADPPVAKIEVPSGTYLKATQEKGDSTTGADVYSKLSVLTEADIANYGTYTSTYAYAEYDGQNGTKDHRGVDITYAVTFIDADATEEVEYTVTNTSSTLTVDGIAPGETVTRTSLRLTDVAKIVRNWEDIKDFNALYEAFGLEYTPGEDGAPGTVEVVDEAKAKAYVPSLFSDVIEDESSGKPFDNMKYTPYIFAVVATSGRGSYGKKYGIQVQNAYTEDKRNDYKNHNLNVLDMETYQIVETYPVSFYENAVSGRNTIFVDDVIEDVDTGSSFIQMSVNSETFDELYLNWAAAFNEFFPSYVAQGLVPATIETFDPITGIEKGTKNPLKGLRIIESKPASALYKNEELDASEYATKGLPNNYIASALTDTLGIGLQSGRDGNFVNELEDTIGIEVPATLNPYLQYATTDEEPEVIQLIPRNGLTAIDYQILQGFLGNIDKSIKSKKRFPTTYILDAGYPAVIKQAINALKTFRTDCVALYDAGDPNIAFTDESFRAIEGDLIAALDGSVDVDSLSEIYNTMEDYILPLRMKVRDIASRKPIYVTYTFLLANLLPQHFLQNNGKHVPFAGAVLGKLSGFIRGTAQPVYEDDIDFDILDEYADNHVNYAKYNADGSISIAMQDTHQDVTSDLSELNAVLIMKDVKRDCENLIEELEYQFNEVSDVIRFNTLLEMRVLPYYSSAQVRSIRGEFSRNSWEAERGILHLYIEIANKDLVKTGIIEIDVVQGDSQQ